MEPEEAKCPSCGADIPVETGTAQPQVCPQCGCPLNVSKVEGPSDDMEDALEIIGRPIATSEPESIEETPGEAAEGLALTGRLIAGWEEDALVPEDDAPTPTPAAHSDDETEDTDFDVQFEMEAAPPERREPEQLAAPREGDEEERFGLGLAEDTAPTTAGTELAEDEEGDQEVLLPGPEIEEPAREQAEPPRRTTAGLIGAGLLGTVAVWNLVMSLMIVGDGIVRGGSVWTLTSALMLLMVAGLGGVGVVYLCRGYSVAWLADHVFALTGLSLGLQLMIIPASGALAATVSDIRLTDPLSGLYCALAGLSIIPLFAAVWGRRIWAKRCAALGILCFAAVLTALELWDESGTLLTDLTDITIGQGVAGLVLAGVSAVLLAVAAAVYITGPTVRHADEVKIARTTLARGLSGVGVVILIVVVVLLWGAVQSAAWCRSIIRLGSLSIGAVAALLILISIVNAWGQEANLSHDSFFAVRFAWPVIALLTVVGAACLLPGLIESSTTASVIVGGAAALIVSACWLGRRGVKWPIAWLSPILVILFVWLISHPSVFVAFFASGLSYVPVLAMAPVALAVWSTVLVMTGLVMAGVVIEFVRESLHVRSYGSATLVIGLGLLVGFGVIAFGLCVALGDAAVQRHADTFASRGATEVGALGGFLAGTWAGEKVLWASSRVAQMALGHLGAALTAVLYALAGLVFVTHLLAAKAVRWALQAVSILWLVGTGLLSLLAVVYAGRVLWITDLGTGGSAWVDFLSGSLAARLMLLAGLIFLILKIIQSTNSCHELWEELKGPEVAEVKEKAPGPPRRQILHLRNLGFFFGVFAWALGLSVSVSPVIENALRELTLASLAVVRLLGGVAQEMASAPGLTGLVAACSFTLLYFLFAFHANAYRARVSTFPWVASVWTLAVVLAGYGIVRSFVFADYGSTPGLLYVAIVAGLVWLMLIALVARLWINWLRLQFMSWAWEGTSSSHFQITPARRSGRGLGILGMWVTLIVAILVGVLLLADAGYAKLIASATSRIVTGATEVVSRWRGELVAAQQTRLWAGALAFAGTAFIGFHLLVVTGGREIRRAVAALWTIILFLAIGLLGYCFALPSQGGWKPRQMVLLIAGLYFVTGILSANVSAWMHLLSFAGMESGEKEGGREDTENGDPHVTPASRRQR